jgi:acyl-CoA synthetase (AMP-forming)/AMP-acid ligase II
MTTFWGPPLEEETGIGALTLGGLLEETTARHGPRQAVVFYEDGLPVRMTYGELRVLVRSLAGALIDAGVVKGTRVGLLMGSRPEWVISAFAVALAGGVLVPLSTYMEPPELDYVLRHCDASVLLTQHQLARHHYLDELRGLCPELAASRPGEVRSVAFPHLRRVVCVGLDAVEGGVEPWSTFTTGPYDAGEAVLDACAAGVSPADDALVIYTSGSTAMPKGVLHSHRAAALQCWRFARQHCRDQEVRLWSAQPFFWTAGFSMTMGATLAAGGCLVLQEFFEPGEALRLLEVERVTTPVGFPHHLAQLEDHPDWSSRDLSSIRQVDSFGSFGRHKTVHASDGYSVRSAYGMTEMFTLVSAVPADTPAGERDGHNGRILPGNAVRILDVTTGEPLGPGAEGEIAVKGSTLMRGYLKVVPEDYLDADGFFRSGDSGFVDEQGRLHWTGRSSDLIKTGGANVSPVEIESALLRHPGLRVALAIGVPDLLLGEVVVVCAVAHDGVVVDELDVREFLRGRIASYKIPRRVLFFEEDQLSLTGSGKIRGEPLRSLAIARLAEEKPPPS